MRYTWAGICSLLLLCGNTQVRSINPVFESNPMLPEGKKGTLSFGVSCLGFFKDNEYSGGIMKGYTLPGFRMQPKFVYYPLENIKLEAGAHLARYWGASKYPCYVYSDIAEWQADQYQHGFHALPWFRAQMALGEHWDIVLGNIYGAANHHLIEPLYNPELNATADPEAGVQVLFHSRKFDLDIWGSWDSFIFQNDTHQEAFTFGVSGRAKWNDPSSRVHTYSTLQILAQHRGGEIDTITTRSVQTLMNGAVGTGVVYNARCRYLKAVGAEVDLAGYYQQAGDLLPYDSGYGVYARAWADVCDFRLKAAFWHSEKFVPLFGSPFFGAVSSASEGVFYPKQQMLQWGAEYERNFGEHYAIGIEAEVYHHIGLGTSFSAGIYMKLNPEFILKKF